MYRTCSSPTWIGYPLLPLPHDANEHGTIALQGPSLRAAAQTDINDRIDSLNRCYGSWPTFTSCLFCAVGQRCGPLVPATTRPIYLQVLICHAFSLRGMHRHRIVCYAAPTIYSQIQFYARQGGTRPGRSIRGTIVKRGVAPPVP